MMFSYAAWTRLTTTAVVLCSLFLTTPAYAHEDRLFTDSVTYCAPPQALLIQNFEIQYIRHNQSVAFNISAASVQEGLNVTANIMLTVYGMNSLNLTFDLCSLTPAICPLPVYQFNGSAEIPLDFYGGLGLVDIQSRIPSIAYVVPDLEAFAQLTLRDSETGKLVACVQATLSNGWSMQQSRARTATIAVVVFAFFAALFQQRLQASRSPLQTSRSPSYSTQRFLDLLHFLQHIVVTGLLDVNYPLAYRSFVVNFGWAFGFIRIGSIQRAIQRMRHATGSLGAANETALDPIAWTNRKQSPYNYNYTIGAVRPNIALALPAVVTPQDAGLASGIPTIVNSLGIPTENAFMSLFFALLLGVCVVVLFFGLLYGVLRATRAVMKQRTPVWVELMLEDYVHMLKAQGVILAFIALLPTMTLAFFQWSIVDSWLAVCFAVLTFIAVVGAIAWTLFSIFRASRQMQKDPLELQSSPALVHALPLFGSYRAQRWSFADLTVLSFFLKAVTIVAARNTGFFQVVFLMVLEFLHLAALLVARPFKSRGGDAFATFLSVIRLLTLGLVIPFLPKLEIAAIPRAALGMGSAVVSSVTVVVLFISIIINVLWGTFSFPAWMCCCRRSRKESPPASPTDSTGLGDDKNGPLSPASGHSSSPSLSSSTAQGTTTDEVIEKKQRPQSGDVEAWRPWTPTPSARQVLNDLPPRPGPPELESRFATPAREIGPGEYDVEFANQLSPIGALPTGLDLDSPISAPYSPYSPSGSFIGSRASISSYGCPVAPELRASWTYAGPGRTPSSGTGSWIATTASTPTTGSLPSSSVPGTASKLASVDEHGLAQPTVWIDAPSRPVLSSS